MKSAFLFVPQPVDPAHHWYYLLEMAFYVSLLLSVSVDVKRKVSDILLSPSSFIDSLFDLILLYFFSPTS